MYSQIDILGLEEIVRSAKKFDLNNRLNMRTWKTACGTGGCLIGSFCASNPNDTLKMVMYVDKWAPSFEHRTSLNAPARRFRLPITVGDFLFTSHNHAGGTYTYAPSALRLKGDQAIARLKKTIAYFKRKQQMWLEHSRIMALPKRERRLIQLSLKIGV